MTAAPITNPTAIASRAMIAAANKPRLSPNPDEQQYPEQN
jgi:hypothetical protein